MFNPTDDLPPTFIRDWWQLLRSKGYIILMALAYLLVWLTFNSVDWNDVARQMTRADALGDCWDFEGSCYPLFSVCNTMKNFNAAQTLWAMLLVAVLIPLRIGGAVAADTRVKGTNFLQVTPLGSWRIVWGMWLSAFSQVLFFAVLALPLLAVRAWMMPMGNEADWYGLLMLVLAGGVYSAAFMFISGLNQLLRYVLMGVLVVTGVALTFLFTDEGNVFVLETAPLWLAGVHVLGAGLITLMLLQLARRPYASPSENTSLPVRLYVLACLALALLCSWGRMELCTEGAPKALEFGLEMPAVLLMAMGAFGALMDALLPQVYSPAHAKRTLPGLPAWAQVPGFLQSAFFLLIPCVVLSILIYTMGVGHSRQLVVMHILSSGDYLWFLVCAILGTGLLIWSPVALSISIGDVFVRRNSSRRPLSIALTFIVLAILSCCFFALGDAEVVAPVANIGASIYKVQDFLGCFLKDNAPELCPVDMLDVDKISDMMQACTVSGIVAVFQTALAVALLLWRHKSTSHQN